jgi:hypothetical protein
MALFVATIAHKDDTGLYRADANNLTLHGYSASKEPRMAPDAGTFEKSLFAARRRNNRATSRGVNSSGGQQM